MYCEKIKANVYSMGKLFVVQPSGKNLFSSAMAVQFSENTLFFSKLYVENLYNYFFTF